MQWPAEDSLDSEGHIDSIKILFLQAGTKAVTNELSKCRSLSYRTIIGHTRPIHGSLSYKIKSTWIRLTQIISTYYPIRNSISVLACGLKCIYVMNIYLTCIFYLGPNHLLSRPISNVSSCRKISFISSYLSLVFPSPYPPKHPFYSMNLVKKSLP